MSNGWVIASVVLALVLISSAVAKLGAVDSTRSVIVLLRLPRFLQAPWVAKALPIGEIVLGLALLLAPSGPLQVAAAVASLLLFVAYWVVVARAMTFDPRPSCGCFGQIGDQRVSAKTLLRNTILVALAVAVLVLALKDESPLEIVGRFAADDWVYAALALVAAVVTALIVHSPGGGAAPPATPAPAGASGSVEPQTRAEARAAAAQGDAGRREDLSDGVDEGEVLDYERAPLPTTVLQRPDDTLVTPRELAAEQAVVIIGVNCGCGTSMATLARLEEWRERLAPIVRIEVLVPVARENAIRILGDHGRNALYDHNWLSWQAFGFTGNPAAILLGADGMTAGGPVAGVQEVADFIDDIAGELDAAREAGELPVPDEG